MSQVQVDQKTYQMPPNEGITVAHFSSDEEEDGAHCCETCVAASLAFSRLE